MTMVIPFAPTSAMLRRKSARAETAHAETATPLQGAAILFFTGVRYERQPEPALDAAPRKRRSAGGKRLARTAAAGQPV